MSDLTDALGRIKPQSPVGWWAEDPSTGKPVIEAARSWAALEAACAAGARVELVTPCGGRLIDGVHEGHSEPHDCPQGETRQVVMGEATDGS